MKVADLDFPKPGKEGVPLIIKMVCGASIEALLLIRYVSLNALLFSNIIVLVVHHFTTCGKLVSGNLLGF